MPEESSSAIETGYRVVGEELGYIQVEVVLRGGVVSFAPLSHCQRREMKRDKQWKEGDNEDKQVVQFWYHAKAAGYEGTFDEFAARVNDFNALNCVRAVMVLQGLDPNSLDTRMEEAMSGAL